MVSICTKLVRRGFFYRFCLFFCCVDVGKLVLRIGYIIVKCFRFGVWGRFFFTGISRGLFCVGVISAFLYLTI